jgi:PadR family transcriptional regulator, regulatory protein PadR
MSQIQQLRKGSTPLLILSVLADGKKYGYQVMRELEQRSEGYFSMTAALLYPALHELEEEGLVASEWEDGEGKRRRKFYTITEKGRGALAGHRADWQSFIAHMQRVLQGDDRKEQAS